MAAKSKSLAVVEENESQHAPGRSTREAKREDRQTRRAEIQIRWNHRAAIRLFEAEDRRTVSDLVNDLMHYGEWAPYDQLVQASGIHEKGLSQLASVLLRVIALKEMDYSEYLKTPEWKTLAVTTKRRYDGKCALDDTHAAIDAHHRTYVRRGRERSNDLIPLCRECHEKFHGKR